MPDALFPLDDTDLLVSVYERHGRTLDDLPYTGEFESIYRDMYGDPGEADARWVPPERAAVFHRLHNLRKAKKLPRLGKARSAPPRIGPEHEAVLVQLVERHVGELSKRDRLLYTPAFDDIVDAFNADTGRTLSPHDLWRIVAKLAK